MKKDTLGQFDKAFLDQCVGNGFGLRIASSGYRAVTCSRRILISVFIHFRESLNVALLVSIASDRGVRLIPRLLVKQ